MKKRMLEKYTSLYDKVPSWLMIMLSCFIALGYFLISGFLSGMLWEFQWLLFFRS